MFKDGGGGFAPKIEELAKKKHDDTISVADVFNCDNPEDFMLSLNQGDPAIANIVNYIIENKAFDQHVLFAIIDNFKNFENYFVSCLNFNNDSNFNITVGALDLIEKMYWLDCSEAWKLDLENVLLKCKDAFENGNTNYFLSLRLGRLIKELSISPRERNEDYLEKVFSVNDESPKKLVKEELKMCIEHEYEKDGLPYKVAPDVYAKRADGNLLISNKEDYEAVTRLIQEFDLFMSFLDNFGEIDFEGINVRRDYDDLPRHLVKYFDHYSSGEFGKLSWQDFYSIYDEHNDENSSFFRPLDEDDLFVSENEKFEEAKKDFSEIEYHDVRKEIESEFGITLSELTLKEQYNFLQFAKSRKCNQIPDLSVFVRQFGENALKSFLVLEADFTNGERFVELGKRISPNIVNMLLAKISDITDLTNDLREKIKAEFKSGKVIDESEYLKVASFVLGKVDALIKKTIARCNDEGQINHDEMLDELDAYKSDLILTAGIWASADKNSLEFTELKGISFEVQSANKLTNEGKLVGIVEKILTEEADSTTGVLPMTKIRLIASKNFVAGESEDIDRIVQILEMYNIYHRNYSDKPELRKKILTGFLDKLRTSSSNTKIYSFMKDGQVVAFNRFDDLGNGKKYFGSFNVDSTLTNSAIGTALIKESLEVEMASHEIIADCLPDSPISSSYIEKLRFVVDSFGLDYAGTGENVFGIRKQMDGVNYKYKELSRAEIIREHNEFFSGNMFPANSQNMVLKFNVKSVEFIDACDQLVNRKGLKITRYIFDNNGQVYCAFEKGGS